MLITVDNVLSGLCHLLFFLVSYKSIVIVYFGNLEYEKKIIILRRHILMFLVNIKTATVKEIMTM